MESPMKRERDIILADPIICAALTVEADSVGVSLEQYVERFLEVFYGQPEKLAALLTKQA